MSTSLSYSLFTENQWVFPETALSEGKASLSLETARGGHTLCQILTDETVKEGTPVSFSVSGANGITVTLSQLLPVFVKKNSAPRGKMGTTDDYESVKSFATKKAPFEVYDALFPLAGGTLREGRLALSLALSASSEIASGTQEIAVVIRIGEKELAVTLPVTVYAFTVPPLNKKSPLVCNWLYPIHLAEDYGVEPYSEEFWPIYREYLAHQLFIRSNQLCLVNLGKKNCIPAIHDAEGRIVDFDLSGYEKALKIGVEMGFTQLYGCFVAHWPKWDCPNLYLLWDWEKQIDVESAEGYRILKIYFTRVKEMIERNGWQNCYMQTLVDEPQFQNARAYRVLCSIVRQLLPGVIINEAIETTDALGAVDIWCVKQAVYERYLETYQRYQAMGERMTYYTCGFPAGDTMNRVLDLPLFVGRLSFWMCQRYHFEGFLHWGYHRGNDIAFTHVDENCSQPAGNQSIIYVVDGVFCESLRSMNQLFGVEDYEAIRAIAKEDAALADQLVQKCCRTFDDYETSASAVEAVRHEILLTAATMEILNDAAIF